MNDTASLFYKNGTSDKVYFLRLEQTGADAFTVVAQNGRRGGTLTPQVKTKNGAIPYADAKKLFDKVKRTKIAEGYRESDSTSAPANQVAAPESAADVKTPELLTEIGEREVDLFLDDPAYWMQDKSDGHSRGVVKRAGKIFGLNKLAKPVPLPEEIHAELKRIRLETFQIDAEIVGSKLVCRDLLDADGDISDRPYGERFIRLIQILRDLIEENSNVTVVRNWTSPDEKRWAIKRQREERREGVVFKLVIAPYVPGRNGQHKKFKFVKTLSAIAGKPRATGKDSVEVFLVDGDPFSNKLRVGTVSMIGKSAIAEGDVIEVAYLYASSSKMLQQARMLRHRDDVHWTECTTAQLVMKREE